jgi:hypothetical protein
MSYTPNIQYDAITGYLTKYNEFSFNYDPSTSELNKIDLIDPFGIFSTIPGYNLNNEINYFNSNLVYTNTGTPEPSTTVFSYDALDRVIKETDYAKLNLCPGGATGCVISNLRGFLTGNAVLGSSEGYARYYTTPGDSSSGITSDEYLKLLQSDIISPELAEYYQGAVNPDGSLNQSWLSSSCQDSDSGDNATYIFGTVTQNQQFFYDSCSDAKTLIEYDCKPAWFFGLIGTPKVHSYKQTCLYGCSSGACLNQPLLNTTIIQNQTSSCSNKIQDGNETGIDCGGSCEPCIDLPPEPETPN